MASSGVDACDSALKKKVCKHCKKNVINAMNCINCDGSFHGSCARNSSRVKCMENGNIVCCETNDCGEDTDVAFFDALSQISDNGKIDLAIFNYIVKQKDMIIEELQEKVKMLNTQLETVSNPLIHNKASMQQKNHAPQKVVSSKSHQNENMPVAENKHLNTVSKQMVSSALMEASTLQKCNDIINLENDKHNNEWKDVKNHRRRRKAIVGNNNEIKLNGKLIQGVPKFTHLHVYRLEPKITENDLQGMLKLSFPEVKCEALISKHPQVYSSFKVTLLESNFGNAMDPSKWPSGALIQPFLELRKKSREIQTKTNAPPFPKK